MTLLCDDICLKLDVKVRARIHFLNDPRISMDAIYSLYSGTDLIWNTHTHTHFTMPAVGKITMLTITKPPLLAKESSILICANH